jgi:cation diffusion facilitator family transporter
MRQKFVAGERRGDLGGRSAPVAVPPPVEGRGEEGGEIVNDLADLAEQLLSRRCYDLRPLDHISSAAADWRQSKCGRRRLNPVGPMVLSWQSTASSAGPLGRQRRVPPESTRTVVVALVVNLSVALAKIGAAVITGSTAMAAEAAHAVADTGNQVLLLEAQRRSVRPADERHPFGYGRDAYFWALIASVGVFVAGAVFSLREGVDSLLHQVDATSFGVAYGILAISAIFDSVSLVQAVRQLRSEARLFRRDFLDQVVLTSDPTVRAVFAEDAAAIAGDVIALVGVALHQATGSPLPDAIAAVLIGMLLVAVSVQLARRNRDFLLGEQAPPAVRVEVERSVASKPGVVAIKELALTYLGPRRIWVLARVDVDDGLRGDEVEALVRAIDEDLRSQSPYIVRVDVVPIGRSG